MVRGGAPSREGSLLAGLVCCVTLRAPDFPSCWPCLPALEGGVQSLSGKPSRRAWCRVEGREVADAHRPEGRKFCQAVRGRTPELGWSGGGNLGVRYLGQGRHRAMGSVPGFKSPVCPLLTICPGPGDCLSQPGAPHLDDGQADSTPPVGLGHRGRPRAETRRAEHMFASVPWRPWQAQAVGGGQVEGGGRARAVVLTVPAGDRTKHRAERGWAGHGGQVEPFLPQHPPFLRCGRIFPGGRGEGMCYN